MEEVKATMEYKFIHFGTYPQGKSGEILPIKWRILKQEGSRAFITSETALATMAFHTDRESGDISWMDNCNLHEWLNIDFYEQAFSDEEKGHILPITYTLTDNKDLSFPAGNDDFACYNGSIPDRLFLLSEDETVLYMPEEIDRICPPSDYSVSQGIKWSDYTHGCWWWLRTSGYSNIFARTVYDFGFISTFGYDAFLKMLGVRPALWIQLS